MLGKRRLSAGQLESPAKRRATSVPCTPQKPRPQRASYVPRPSLDFSGLPETPLDSPGNPLGRHHVVKLSRRLPDPSSFGKHVVLRMQLVVHSAKRVHPVYRIVQLPLNYTFTHLRALIAYLFGGPHDGDDHSGGRHVFEVKRDVVMHSKKRPGEIFSAVTTVKLSGSKHPFTHQDEEKVFDDDEDELQEDDTRWEGEEDFTIAQVFPMGLNSSDAVKDSLTRAIVWKSNTNPAVQLHLTINTEAVKTRRGKGNAPFVFRSHGQTSLLARNDLGDYDDVEEDAGGDTETDEEGDETDPMIARWNREGAFEKFFRRRAIRTLGELEVDEPKTPGLTYSSSPTQASSSPVLPTPANATNVYPFPSVYASGPSSSYMHGNELPFSTFPKFTPLPSAHLRKRVDSTEKFIALEKRKPWMTKYDEVDSDRGSSAEPEETRLGPARKRKVAVSVKAGGERVRASALLKAEASRSRSSALLKASAPISMKAVSSKPASSKPGPSHEADDEELDDDFLTEMLRQSQEEDEDAARAEEDAGHDEEGAAHDEEGVAHDHEENPFLVDEDERAEQEEDERAGDEEDGLAGDNDDELAGDNDDELAGDDELVYERPSDDLLDEDLFIDLTREDEVYEREVSVEP
ncbi:uncharacterized protein SCHCODRAFT_02637192 [Schizophyllum commune H4-8]|uniref:Expressed protein n=1 Tax=Schizophyllum commune (strain H4-8 / FGSC 9210) TaxID=578458 RepID=D8QDR8_SCHCM|nr:uncharacterized protein SCHCODRAFT_02637192 [Schizophyllum commune H4-8]KAI5888604.1 hypothetical protein SCHCODRAFT_02637192 [Schizophyllum commune H4-8]